MRRISPEREMRSKSSRIVSGSGCVALLVCLVVGMMGCSSLPEGAARPSLPPAGGTNGPSPVPTTPMPSATLTATPSLTPTATPSPTPGPVVLDVARLQPALSDLVREHAASLPPLQIDGASRPLVFYGEGQESDAWLAVESLASAHTGASTGEAVILWQRYYAAVAPFQTISDTIPSHHLRNLWGGSDQGALLVAQEEVVQELAWLWGPCKAEAVPQAEMKSRLQATPSALGLVRFDALDPTLKVLTVDGANVLSNQLDPASYPLGLAVVMRGPLASAIAPAFEPLFTDATNRDPARLTQLIMTGVTAMCRLTAERMERLGSLYPALVISDTLRAADITHASNEVPFIQGCVPDTRSGNLVFCSDYDYWDALEAIGTDLVGLSGNHVNVYGTDGARESLAFYREREIPAYGSGLNVDQACAPIRLDDHGTSFAFLATLAWNPSSAWATDTLPGTCYYYQERERLVDAIRQLKLEGVDIVSVELQYLETYNPFPTGQQVQEFRELYDAGADIVTGVQSHVPQAWEPYSADESRPPGIVVYGLGNLFFDQMWSWETRTGLIARHTIYGGRLISSEILTTVLEDAAQPRWATQEERAEILQRIFEATPERR